MSKREVLKCGECGAKNVPVTTFEFMSATLNGFPEKFIDSATEDLCDDCAEDVGFRKVPK